DNGDPARSAYTYATDGRTIIGRPNFVNKVFNKNSGLILTGSDLAQSMLRDYDLDAKISDRNYVGTGYKGYAMGFHWQSAPDYIWTLAEKYLGLDAGALDNVYAIAVSYEATAMGRIVDLGVKLIDANEVRGVKAQPLNIWGHEAFRKSFVIGNSTLDNTYLSTTLGLSEDERLYPVAPKVAHASDEINVPIYNAAGQIVGYQIVAQGAKPNGDNFKSGVQNPYVVAGSYSDNTFTAGGTTYSIQSNSGVLNVVGTVPYAAADASLGLGAGNRITVKISNPAITSKEQLPSGNIVTSSGDGYTNPYTKTAFENDGSLILVTNVSKTVPHVVTVKWATSVVTTYTINSSAATFAAE
ncbi:MAG: hypothetical protein IJQ23_06600, partial [Clostridia bacterium]|nr:hypothetical protein [Clostridia bacterium]